jgi:hypothetical protein
MAAGTPRDLALLEAKPGSAAEDCQEAAKAVALSYGA